MPTKYEAPERNTQYGPGPDTQGGGFRGGPKRWTGRGPAPARHIPWPEIFRHHISVVEGHLKMIEMVWKHTEARSGNRNNVEMLVERSREMLWQARGQAKTFIPPRGQREQVPIGVSSASMYPGYSPADHEYGKAAEEFGHSAGKMKAQGLEPEYGDLDYKIGQAKGALKKPKTIGEIREEREEMEKRKIREEMEEMEKRNAESAAESESCSGFDNLAKRPKQTNAKTATNGQSSSVKEPETVTAGAQAGGDGEVFFIDTNPTPVNLPGISHQPPKRSVTPEPTEGKKNKKAKKQHDGDLPAGEGFEDIEEEVDARLKEKEEKKTLKEKKKRKRVSDESNVAQIDVDASATTDPAKPTKKKKKTKSEDAVVAVPLPEEINSKKRGAEGEADVDGEGDGQKAKKKVKKPRKSKRRTVDCS